jgi:hypothetical protein
VTAGGRTAYIRLIALPHPTVRIVLDIGTRMAKGSGKLASDRVIVSCMAREHPMLAHRRSPSVVPDAGNAQAQYSMQGALALSVNPRTAQLRARRAPCVPVTQRYR